MGGPVQASDLYGWHGQVLLPLSALFHGQASTLAHATLMASAMSQLLPSLLLSLRIAVLATMLAAMVAVPLAWWMARHRLPGRSVFEALLCVPLVLPPTVVGYFIIMLLGKQGWLTGWVGSGYSILFRVEGAVLTAAVVALPMLYIPAKAAFAGVERELEDVAVLMGAGRFRVFWNVSIPIARRGLISGLILAFARSLGEFGATLMVYGNQVRVRGRSANDGPADAADPRLQRFRGRGNARGLADGGDAVHTLSRAHLGLQQVIGHCAGIAERRGESRPTFAKRPGASNRSAMPSNDTYESPLATRNASPEMLRLFSPQHKFGLWRRLWLELARCERELGLSRITRRSAAADGGEARRHRLRPRPPTGRSGCATT